MILSRIMALCEKKGISISKLEEVCRLGKGSIARWCECESDWRVENLKKVADYFGVEIKCLLDDQELNREIIAETAYEILELLKNKGLTYHYGERALESARRALISCQQDTVIEIHRDKHDILSGNIALS